MVLYLSYLHNRIALSKVDDDGATKYNKCEKYGTRLVRQYQINNNDQQLVRLGCETPMCVFLLRRCLALASLCNRWERENFIF